MSIPPAPPWKETWTPPTQNPVNAYLRQRQMTQSAHASHPEDPIYIGTHEHPNLGYLPDFEAPKERAQHNTMHPRKYFDNTQWTPSQGKAFVHGLLAGNRPVELVTNPSAYEELNYGSVRLPQGRRYFKTSQPLASGTMMELASLYHHGYRPEAGSPRGHYPATALRFVPPTEGVNLNLGKLHDIFQVYEDAQKAHKEKNFDVWASAKPEQYQYAPERNRLKAEMDEILRVMLGQQPPSREQLLFRS